MNNYYQYWEDFIAEWACWSSVKSTIGGWTNPDNLPLCNKDWNDLTSQYIPEPWWGNDGTQSLHSVVVNFNPGEGDCPQKRGTIPYVSSFANDIVGNPNVLPKTRQWHQTRRAMRVLNTLYRLKYINKPYGLENHLSVEFIPWHTKGVNCCSILYLKQNIKAVYDHSICFAANESRRIANKKLHNVVIVRMNDVNTKIVLDELNLIGVGSEIMYSSNKLMSGNGHYMVFKLNTMPDIKFVSIWGNNSRNDFPSNNDMDEIFKSI